MSKHSTEDLVATITVGAGILAGVAVLFLGFYWSDRLAAALHLRSLPNWQALPLYGLLMVGFFGGAGIAFKGGQPTSRARKVVGVTMMVASALIMRATFD